MNNHDARVDQGSQESVLYRSTFITGIGMYNPSIHTCDWCGLFCYRLLVKLTKQAIDQGALPPEGASSKSEVSPGQSSEGADGGLVAATAAISVGK